MSDIAKMRKSRPCHTSPPMITLSLAKIYFIYLRRMYIYSKLFKFISPIIDILKCRMTKIPAGIKITEICAKPKLLTIK